jgi:hypothetical protein
MHVDLIERGQDDERAYLAFFVIRADRFRLTPRALFGVEISTRHAIEGPGVTVDFLYIKIRFA